MPAQNVFELRIAVTTSDYERLVKFYCAGLGLEPAAFWDNGGKAIEPDFEPSIGLVMDTQAGKMGPLWVRGGIPIESADGKTYEIRNRVTLCRCGKSSNKPFCDGSHLK